MSGVEGTGELESHHAKKSKRFFESHRFSWDRLKKCCWVISGKPGKCGWRLRVTPEAAG